LATRNFLDGPGKAGQTKGALMPSAAPHSSPAEPSPLSAISAAHLDRLRVFHDAAPTEPPRLARHYRSILARYFNLMIPADASVLEIGCGSGALLAGIQARRRVGVDLSVRQVEAARARLPDAEFHVQAGETLALEEQFDVIIISDTLNFAADVQALLERLHTVSHEGTRLLLNFPSALWRPAYQLASWFGQRAPQPESSWLSSSDVANLLELSRWEVVRREGRVLFPLPVPLLAPLLNRWLAPLVSALGVTVFTVARPRRETPRAELSVSVIVPARNEAGNIEDAIRRMPRLGRHTEVIFVEGHSRDHTWAEIQRVAAAHPEWDIKIMQQTGRGKGDAVRLGFAAATGDVLMILDADLTMPPEELPKFYDAIARGRAEFANGCRLVYPMDEKAMQFLNLCANKTFGLIFTWLLGQSVKDTLCGTKVLRRSHYLQIAARRSYFGDFDPFGDFDLLFGAAKLNLKISDIPIRYKERTYGTTNIQRWKHGWLLLRMVLFAARKLKFV
jgi:SAM-dependent methyltransferase